jgi:hypothetical protein
MFDQILDNYRKATEATLQFQQMMLRGFGQQWPPTFGVPIPGVPIPTEVGAWPEQLHKAQKKLGETITDMLNKHRETLDAQYRAGIRAIEDAFRVGEAKDPEQYRKLIEELWRHSYECLKSLAESQMRDTQTLMQKWFELASQGASAVKN